MRKTLKVATIIGLALILLFTLSIYLQLELPATTGPYSVGQTLLKWVDTTRPEVLTENPNDYREGNRFHLVPSRETNGNKGSLLSWTFKRIESTGGKR